MKKYITYTFSIVLTVVVAVIFAGTALAAGSVEQISQPPSGNYETAEGILSIKEGHGEFLVRMPDGKAQRFSVKMGAAKITRNGKPVRYNELKISDSVQVQYDGSTREVIAIHAQGS
jgi:hypothetical protein